MRRVVGRDSLVADELGGGAADARQRRPVGQFVSYVDLEARVGPLKAIEGSLIRLPRHSEHRPDRDRLAGRFEQFKRVA